MKTIKIMLDFLAGPIWKPYYNSKTHEDSTGVDVVDHDKEIAKLNDEIQDMFFSYYYFDYKGQACYFDFEQERADKDKMLELLQRLNNRLAELNDGSFIVDDQETDRVKAL